MAVTIRSSGWVPFSEVEVHRSCGDATRFERRTRFATTQADAGGNVELSAPESAYPGEIFHARSTGPDQRKATVYPKAV